MCDVQNLRQIKLPLRASKHPPRLTQNLEPAQLKIWIRLCKKTKPGKNITLEDLLTNFRAGGGQPKEIWVIHYLRLMMGTGLTH